MEIYPLQVLPLERSQASLLVWVLLPIQFADEGLDVDGERPQALGVPQTLAPILQLIPEDTVL